jgi:hypothetical protein
MLCASNGEEPFMTNTIHTLDLREMLVETTTDSHQYEVTDSQVSSTASIQNEFLFGNDSVLTLR